MGSWPWSLTLGRDSKEGPIVTCLKLPLGKLSNLRLLLRLRNFSYLRIDSQIPHGDIFSPLVARWRMEPTRCAHRVNSLAKILALVSCFSKLLSHFILNLNFLKSVFNNRFIISNSWRVNSDHVNHMIFRDQHLFWVFYSEFELGVLLEHCVLV